MKFRYARHTNDLEKIISFYTNVLGLQILGGFENHENYNGVFLGFPGKDWHLEYTSSNDEAQHLPNKDDLLVFYLEKNQMDKIKSILSKKNIIIETSKNPYWQRNGIEIKDPDGFGIILTLDNKV